MNLAMQRYEAWRVQPSLDETLAKELLAMEGDAEKITDSFGCDLAFGTAGLRGVLGAGTNRMNIYTVARPHRVWPHGSQEASFPRKLQSPMTAASTAFCFRRRRRVFWRQTASRSISTRDSSRRRL